MFISRSMGYSTYIGLIWDGRGKAARGWVDLPGPASHTKFQHVAFMNFTEAGCGTAEEGCDYLDGSEWRNCLFVNCHKGLAVWHYNDYNWTIDGCNFYDCDYGIWCRHGNVYVRNCHFERSKEADIALLGALHGCSVRRCTSVGSRLFLLAHGWETTLQDCHVSGWTNPTGVIICGRAPMLIFDCVFTNPPSTNPPINLDKNGTPVVHSNNKTSTPELFSGNTNYVLEIPPGKRGGSIKSAHQSFFKSKVTIPTKVFDAKRDFSAKGDGKNDDTEAIQRTIDAARNYGKGAVAYLPRGIYRVSRTIKVTGGNYYIQGAGIFFTRIIWTGDKVGPVILISDPQNLTLEHMTIDGRGVVVVRQVSTTPRPSRMHYEHVELLGAPIALPHKFPETPAFEAVNLSKGSVLTAWDFYSATGGMSFENCFSAIILFNVGGHHSMGTIRVKGTQLDRSGFFGIQTCQTRFRIEDNQSLVGSDCYEEQMGFHDWSQGPYAYLSGSPTLPPGRVTISAPKMCGAHKKGGPPFEVYFIVDNYYGRLSSVMSQYWNPNPTYDPDKKAFKVVCTGEAPLQVLLMANGYQQVGRSSPGVFPVVEGGSNVKVAMLGNTFTYLQWLRFEPVPNVNLTPEGLRLAAQALDDFRELGELDLKLNHLEE